MKALFEPLRELSSFEQLNTHVEYHPGVILATGCIDAQKSHIVTGLHAGTSAKILIAHDEPKARELLAECQFFAPQAVYFPAKDILFYQSDVRGNALTRERMLAYQALFEQEAPVIVTTMDAVLERIIPLETIKNARLVFAAGMELDLEDVRHQLVRIGYEYNYQAEQPGQFAVRGGILDVFPLTEEAP